MDGEMSKPELNDPDGLVTQAWVPNFTVARLIVITTLIAVGCATYPFFPTFIDGGMFLVAIIGLSVGVLYRNYQGWIIAMVILFAVGSFWITLLGG